MTNNYENLFKVTFDETAIRKIFESFEAHLKIHDEQIAELQKMLKDCCTNKDLDEMREKINKENENRIKELGDSLKSQVDDHLQQSSNSMSDMLNQLKEQIKEDISKDIESKIGENVQKKLEENIDAIKNSCENQLQEDAVNQNDNSNQQQLTEDELFEKLTPEEKITKMREQLKELKELVDENREYIQCMCSAYTGIAKTDAELGPTLNRSLNNTTETISRNFKRIFDALKTANNPNSTTSTDQDSSKSTSAKQVQLGSTVGNNSLENRYPPEIDISDLNFVGSEIPASFEEVPQLPQIYKFQTLPEAVQYLYDSIPKLQGYLNAIHQKVADGSSNSLLNDSNASNGNYDPSSYDKLLSSVRKALNDMSGEIEELRRTKKGLTKRDVIDIVKDLIGDDHEQDDETSVGYVRCIACGREMRQVTGAMTEEQATKRLGNASNTLAVDKAQPMYGSLNLSERNFIDSPRSIRSPRKKSLTLKPESPR